MSLPEAPVVSVLVPTYQHGPYIAACLDSILAQRTNFPFEVLVGEDGSTDGTRAICERYAAAHPDRIRLFLRSRKDVVYIQGQATGRGNLKRLLEDARGTYIALCEGDDLWLADDKLQRQVDALEQDPACSAAYHNTRVIDEHGATVAEEWRPGLPAVFTLSDVVAGSAAFHTSSFLVRNYPMFRPIPAFFTKVSVADMMLFTLAASMGRMVHVGGVLSAYRKHAAGITTTGLYNGPRFHIERMRLWMYLDRHFPGRIRDETSRVCSYHWTKVRELCTRGARLRALWDLFRSVPMWFVVRPRMALHYLRSALVG